MKSNIGTILLLITIGVLLSLLFSKQRALNSERNYSESLVDSIQYYRDAEGNYVAKISTIQDENTDLFLALKSSDSTIIKLQEALIDAKAKGGIKKPGSSVTVVERGTSVGIYVPSTTTELEGYLAIRSEFNLGGWVVGNVLAKRDSTEINLQVNDAFTVRLDYEPSGFLGLGRGKPFTELTSLNPYSKTKTLRTYQVSMPPEPNIVVGPSIGVGYPSGWFIGFTATYSWLKFRL